MFQQKNEYIYALAFSVFGGASFLTTDNMSFVVGIIGALFTASTFIFKKINKIVDSYNQLTRTVEKIHSEIFVDNDYSLKDMVLTFQKILERIEIIQKIVEQRSKYLLHYHDHALFETDKNGALVWSSEKFCTLSNLKHDEVLGNNWYSAINEPEREAFIEELNSCLKMCRKFDVETVLYSGIKAKFYGQPYKIDNTHQEGFLFKVVT